MSAVVLQFPQRHQFDRSPMERLVDMEATRPGVVEQFCAIADGHDDSRSHAYARELRRLLGLRNCGKRADMAAR